MTSFSRPKTPVPQDLQDQMDRSSVDQRLARFDQVRDLILTARGDYFRVHNGKRPADKGYLELSRLDDKVVYLFGHFGQRNWPEWKRRKKLGRIADDSDGRFRPFKALHLLQKKQRRDVWNWLKKFRKDPLTIIQQTGRATGVCCICNKFLTHPDSVAAGIGPICAGRMGLDTTGAAEREGRLLEVKQIPEFDLGAITGGSG
jgi:hypothetical protein